MSYFVCTWLSGAACIIRYDDSNIPWIAYHNANGGGNYFVMHWYGTWPP